MLVAGLVMGLALGVAWSPREAGVEAGQDAGRQAGGGGGGQSIRMGGGGGVPGKTRRERSSRTERSGGGVRTGELSAEALMEVMGGIRDETDLNLMELARMAGMITRLSEMETLGLLIELTVEDGTSDEDRDMKEIRGMLAGIVFTRLCELNGPEAMRMAADEELGEQLGKNMDDVLAIGMNSWVAADPDGARQWMDVLLGQADQLAIDGGGEEDLEGMMALLKDEDLLVSYMRGMARHDAEGLAESVGKLRHEEVRKGVEAKVFEAVAATETSAEGLVKLLEQYDDAPSFDGRMEAIERLSKLDNARAAEWVEARPVSVERDNLITRVGLDMLEEDPAAAAEWYMAQEMKAEHRDADRMQRIAWRWGKQDYEATAEWLVGQPDNSARDASESSMAQLAADRKDWGTSLGWIGGIADEEIRSTALNQVLRRGWNSSERVMNAELLEAAALAGVGDAAREYGAK